MNGFYFEEPVYNTNFTVFLPPSFAYAFYPFDSNVLDLYCLRDGTVDPKLISYTVGYVAYGRAIVFNSTTPTEVSVDKTFNFSQKSYTLEAFVYLFSPTVNGSLMRFSSGVSITIEEAHVRFYVSERYLIQSYSPITINEWHHIAAVYSDSSQYATLSIDGDITGSLAYLVPSEDTHENATLKIGTNFEGRIDQLAISTEVKSVEQILWDATVEAYYPFEGSGTNALLDYGPNVQNATSGGTRGAIGYKENGLMFNISGAFFETPQLTSLNHVNHSFSIAFWIYLDSDQGVILTISNSLGCLLIIGIEPVEQRLVVYLPDRYNNSEGVNIKGSPTSLNQWIHVAFTWSLNNQVQLYKDAALDARRTSAFEINQGQGDAMKVTVGLLRGTQQCQTGPDLNIDEQFIGVFDEFYVFSREIQQYEIETLHERS